MGDQPFDLNQKKQFCIDQKNVSGNFFNRDLSNVKSKIEQREDDLYYEENVLEQLLKEEE
jgi:hypothetical protein